MHRHHIERYQHAHVFLAPSRAAERRTRLVMLLTLTAMLAEIGAGLWCHSLALLADGWHMSTHAAALGLAALAYYFARRYAHDQRFTFGTWKMEVLAGYTSAWLLALVGLGIVYAAVERLLHPRLIQYREALLVALLGLLVNLVCALILRGRDATPVAHAHPHEHASANTPHDPHPAHVHDLNLRAAYLHVLADALTSVLAIVALLGGLWRDWRWLDALAGLLGAIMILRWAWQLLRDTALILLDAAGAEPLATLIRTELEQDGDTRVTDLHLWRVGVGQYACIVALIAAHPKPPDAYRQLLAHHRELAHLTIEMRRCEDACERGAHAGPASHPVCTRP
ncbi:MAG: CDF family Co(II)/Ni(II) efflux transporter DmeF [bacterium]|nr:CDF family Co(II)/Ni(II) efflux transporter DmeF [bacterium]